MEVKLASVNDTMKAIHQVKMEVQIAGEDYTVNLYSVPDLEADLILGYPWLEDQHAVIDVHRKCIHLGLRDRRTAYWCEPPTLEDVSIHLGEVHHEAPAGQADTLEKLLNQNKVIFRTGTQLQQTMTVEHHIELRDTKPFRIPPYRYSEEKKRTINTQVDEMLRDDIIEPSNSPYGSPIVIVRKKDATPRFCIDYRRLNSLTKDVNSTLPIIGETLKDLGAAKIFTTLDLKSGYWQVRMAETSKELTAFSTPDGGTYQFKVMPFGLKGAPSTFQKLMSQDVLVGYLREFCLVYLDDIIIYSRDWSDHLMHLGLVFERLQLHGLTCALTKCHFGKRSLQYLGYEIHEGGYRPLLHHLETLEKMEPPKNRKQVRSFVGLCNWLREFVPEFATLAAPLTDLLKTNRRWKWTPEAQRSFEQIKAAYNTPRELQRPDATKPFVLQIRSSDVGAGATLYQEAQPGGPQAVVTYGSCKFTRSELKYSAPEKACLSIMWAVRRYRPYLEDRHFLMETDDGALRWLQDAKDGRSKLTKWALMLQEYSFDIRPGPRNKLPITALLAEDPEGDHQVEESPCDRITPPIGSPPVLRVCTADVYTLTDEVRAAQIDSEELRNLIARWKQLKEVTTAERNNADTKFYEKYLVRNEIIWDRAPNNRNHLRLVVPGELQQKVIRHYHENGYAGHPGAEETSRSIRESYNWRTMVSDVKEFVNECLVCACYKRDPRPAPKRMRARHPAKPWETIAVDLMGPYPCSNSGKRHLFVVTDLFTRWVEAFPVGTAKSSTLIKTLEKEVFCRYGFPRAVLSDNGPQFRSRAWDAACKTWKCALWTTPIYHPRANPTERRNQEIKKSLRIYLQDKPHRTWDRHIPNIVFSLRNRRNAATGCTPSEALLGYDARKPGDWTITDLADADPEVAEPRGRVDQQVLQVERIRLRQETYRRRYETELPTPRFAPGDLVLVKTHHLSEGAEGFHAGLAAKWEGPLQIVRHKGAGCYEVQRGGQTVKYYDNQIRPAPPNFAPTHLNDRQPAGPSQAPATRQTGRSEMPGKSDRSDTNQVDTATNNPEGRRHRPPKTVPNYRLARTYQTRTINRRNTKKGPSARFDKKRPPGGPLLPTHFLASVKGTAKTL